MKYRKLVFLAFNMISLFSLCAAFYLPFMHSKLILDFPGWVPDMLAQKISVWIVDKGEIPIGPHYLWQIIKDLFISREIFIGLAIAVFSILFPIMKILLIFMLTLLDNMFSDRLRERITEFTSIISKWSMADVFIVGMIIVFMKADGFHFEFSAGQGLYFYAVAAFSSSLAFQFLLRTSSPERKSNE